MIRFAASSTEIRVFDEYEEEFRKCMSELVPHYHKVLTSPEKATRFAVEAIFHKHPEWFDFLFCEFRRGKEFAVPDFIVRRNVEAGLTLQEASA